MIGTNRWYSAVDDEVTIIDRAAAPLSKTVHLFLSGVGQHEHPPLYDILLHIWLSVTGGNIHLVRLPATIFYLAGIWLVMRAAREMGGKRAEIATLVLCVLSPYGFHFGRLAAWYSFTFMLVALVTILYLKYLSQRTTANWALLCICSVALVYSNYFAWVLLALLALDFVVVNRQRGFRALLPILGMGAVVLAAFLPILFAFFREIRVGVHPYRSALTLLLNAVYVLYCMFVSESVAPWFWPLGVPATIAVAVAVILTFRWAPPAGKRFAAYCFAALAAMSIIGVLETKRVMLIAPWLVLPVALALGAVEGRMARRSFAWALVVIFAIGWYGICDRNVYSAPHWVEPWDDVAHQAADAVRGGGIVIGNNSSFFFYLTYLLPPDSPSTTAGYAGLLPDSVQRRGVYSAEQWIESGTPATYPMAQNMMLVKGLHYGTPSTDTDEAQQFLDLNCRITADRLLVRDIGAQLKLRFGPVDNQQPWRVEVRSYACR